MLSKPISFVFSRITHFFQARLQWLIGFSLLILSTISQTSENFTIVHGATPQSQLMEFHSDGSASGFKPLLVEQLAHRLNWQVHHQQCPFQRCLFSMRKGRYDLMVFVSAILERSAYLDFIQAWPNTRVIQFNYPNNRPLIPVNSILTRYNP